MAEDTDVVFRIYNTTGQLVRSLSLGRQRAGSYASREKAAYWDGTNEIGEQVASGVYFYLIQAEGFTAKRRMLMLK